MSKVSEIKGNLDDDEWMFSEASNIRVGNTLGRPTSVFTYDIDMDWIEEEKKKNTSQDIAFVSSNDIVTSWMLKLAKPTVGTMVFNYRKRVKEITESFAGNYVTHVTY
jgi:hypothetical protein